MKNKILLTAVVVLMSVCANAQMFSVQNEQQQQLQQMQQFVNPQQSLQTEGIFNNVGMNEVGQDLFVVDLGVDPIMDLDHGGDSDQPGNVAPLGSGAALLVAMGAAYAFLRRRKEDK